MLSNKPSNRSGLPCGQRSSVRPWPFGETLEDAVLRVCGRNPLSVEGGVRRPLPLLRGSDSRGATQLVSGGDGPRTQVNPGQNNSDKVFPSMLFFRILNSGWNSLLDSLSASSSQPRWRPAWRPALVVWPVPRDLGALGLGWPPVPSTPSPTA